MTTKPAVLALVFAAAFTCFGDGRMAMSRPPPGWVRTASVHDPSIFRDRDGRYYVFGTHLWGATSKNLISWQSSDFLRNAISQDTARKIRSWNADETAGNWFDYLWAPDIVYNPAMRKYCVYLSANGDDWKSNIVLLTADKVTGPYSYAGSVVYGGFTEETWRETDLAKVLGAPTLPERYVKWGVQNKKWGLMFPNCIDPCVVTDETGGMWMSYGSWSGGIFMLKLDAKTGLRDTTAHYATDAHSDAYFGKKIAGGAYVSGEGSYIRKIGDWYWLFISYGKLDAKGGYNVRVYRSRKVGGPYLDRLGNTPFYDTYAMNFNDSRGVRLFGAYKWKDSDEGMVAQGHNSAFVDKDGRAYIIYHTRTTAGHEGHYIRVHQLFLNKKGWLVAAPYRMRGEKIDPKGTRLAKSIPGEWDIIVHALDVDYAHLGVARPKRATLNANGTVLGDFTGRWEVERGTPYFSISITGPGGFADTYHGVALTQAIDGTNSKTLVFTALGDTSQLTIWGSKAL